MTIGVVGIGRMGTTLTHLFAEAGHEVIVSFSRDPKKLEALANELAAYAVRVGTPAEAVARTDVVLLSVQFSALEIVIAQLGDVSGRILIDSTNPVDVVLPAEGNGGQEIARLLPTMRVVKAFNSLMYDLLARLSFEQPPTVMPLAGDDEAAKAVVARLIREVGFVPLDTGDLASAQWQEPGGPLFNRVLTPEKAEAVLRQLKPP